MMELNGIISVLKPPGMTSSDVVVTLRKKLKIKKVGHTGTLDPAAAGVLPVCIGKATKLAEYITSERKIYRAEMVLGVETDTLDAEGQVVTCTKAVPDIQLIEEIFKQFLGVIKQKPPMYSAVKYKGKRLYELARKGQIVDVPFREVIIYDNRIIQFIPPDRILFEVECSKGTYIRSLCHDMGKAMGCGACLSFLLRMKNGIFSIDNSWTLDEIEAYASINGLDRIIIPMDQSICHFDALYLDDGIFDKIANGNKVSSEFVNKKEIVGDFGSPARVYCRNQFIGIGFINDQSMLQMQKVLL